jgi:hypothetical protein
VVGTCADVVWETGGVGRCSHVDDSLDGLDSSRRQAGAWVSTVSPVHDLSSLRVSNKYNLGVRTRSRICIDDLCDGSLALAGTVCI